ncbi:hypothetical protein E2C01_034144 [Portunus trituberculatus]|uniref:Uncharacterized protein n=1 Tax=Portunus trituberculatus TaxID=210409 RepID=A0A5B7EZS1_PORTR|nr:hypothetical protein [Portunus trituberculatus]
MSNFCQKLHDVVVFRHCHNRLGCWFGMDGEVPVDMAKLLGYRNLALHLYCLCGSDVKHKGVFNFCRGQNGALTLRGSDKPRRNGTGKILGKRTGDGPAAAQHAARRPCQATDGPATVQLVARRPSEPGDGLAAAQPAVGGTGTVKKIGELPTPRPVRFPDSGAAFPELLQEYDLLAAGGVDSYKARREEWGMACAQHAVFTLDGQQGNACCL